MKVQELFEANKFTASDDDKYKVGDKVKIKAGGKWWDGSITKPPHEETKNYGVRFKNGKQTVNTVASESELKRLDEIRGDFDLTDPENKPEVRKAMDKAHDTHAKKTVAAVDMWDKLAKKLKAVKVQNQGESGFGTRSYIIMKLPDDYRIDMFRDDVMLNLPKGQTLSKDDEAKIKAIFKDAGENLYGTNFSTMGDGPGPNAVRTGYYTSIAHNPKFADAIVNTLKYLKTRA